MMSVSRIGKGVRKRRNSLKNVWALIYNYELILRNCLLKKLSKVEMLGRISRIDIGKPPGNDEG